MFSCAPDAFFSWVRLIFCAVPLDFLRRPIEFFGGFHGKFAHWLQGMPQGLAKMRVGFGWDFFDSMGSRTGRRRELEYPAKQI